VLKEVNASAVLVDTSKELAGLPDSSIAAAAAAAKKDGHEGKYLVRLVNTTGQAPLSQLTNRALRERIFAASLARGSRGGDFDNRANAPSPSCALSVPASWASKATPPSAWKTKPPAPSLQSTAC
jgi:Zn-dependent oligopeptidase